MNALLIMICLALTGPVIAASDTLTKPAPVPMGKAPINPESHGISIESAGVVWRIKNLNPWMVFIHYRMLVLSEKTGLRKAERFRYLEPGEQFELKQQPEPGRKIIGVDLLDRTRLKRDPASGVISADR